MHLERTVIFGNAGQIDDRNGDPIVFGILSRQASEDRARWTRSTIVSEELAAAGEDMKKLREIARTSKRPRPATCRPSRNWPTGWMAGRRRSSSTTPPIANQSPRSSETVDCLGESIVITVDANRRLDAPPPPSASYT
jgi:hypothetical protein